uniref:PIN domain-containing protein n=1 Tax=Eutreptiella gymnastica TaxID=73025 RepID=A0A7S1NIA0_9EUGL|mmetsp:Transcript_39228/g.70356  ORF Transcript_39228/g.70356 Transcript_39228/m.70356 type:complete len:204 (+) Transcript_39228:32-643(+)
MGKPKIKMSQKIGAVKKIIEKKDKERKKAATKGAKDQVVKRFKDAAMNEKAKKLVVQEKVASSMYLKWNTALGPPYRVLIDTNFINFSMQAKMDIVMCMMDCLLAKCFPVICSCVVAELERLGPKFKVSLRIAKDPRFQRLLCDRTYADDCIVERVQQNPIYIVGTNDRNLKRRLRKIPGVPIMSMKANKYHIERLPEAYLHD